MNDNLNDKALIFSKLELLPPKFDATSKDILLALNKASRALAELKGVCKSIPNENILINTLSLQESKASSEIENIITTYNDLIRVEIDNTFNNQSAKEVANYAEALKYGYKLLKNNGLITINFIKEIQATIEPNKSGIRKISGTVLKNKDGDTVYVPPQHHDDIITLLENLEKYINSTDYHNIDPLIKMAIIHYQFECIHPFYDGNGRTGRIINILYLIQQQLLDIPVLYLSRYIIKNKYDYYKHLQSISNESSWEAWIIWILEGVYNTSVETIRTVNIIKEMTIEYKNIIRHECDFYSQDLINNLFSHPYTKIDYLVNDLRISRPTATKYLDKLTEIGLLKRKKIGKHNYYINIKLFDMLSNVM